jgi:CheY-like chemotaxis protein
MASAEQRGPLRVLIVEDYEDAATSLSAVLAFDDYDLRIASTGPAAIETTKTWWPDVVLLDIALPGCDGYHVAKRIREACGQKPRPVFIVLSGYGNDADRMRSEAEGIYLHFRKPMDLDLLRGLLHEFASVRRL